ncbi:MAG: hypothetical protein ACI32N_05935 [Bulleidia sp.]
MKELFYRNHYMTASLESYIDRCTTFEEFENMFSDEMLRDDTRVGDYLDELLRKYDCKDSVVSVNAGLNHSYVGNIVNGKKNNPSRNALICICLAIGTTLEEVQQLLKYAGHATLYVRRKRDVAIWFGFMKHEDVDTVNENLIIRKLPPLLKE